jgi:hypothetical protein
MTEKQKRTRRKADEPAKKEPTPAQLRAWEAAKEHCTTYPVRPDMKVRYDTPKVATVGPVDPGAGWMLTDTMGSRSSGFVNSKTIQLLNLSRRDDESKSDDLNEALAFVAAIEPRNEAETALAMQMYGCQQMAYEMMAHAKRASMIPQLQAYGNLANKFMRTFAALNESLSRTRRGGEQVVRHIHVNAQQAIVAETVNYGGRAHGRSDEQPYGAADAGMLGASGALPSPDPLGNGVPIPCNAERALSPSRREVSGGAEGQS